MNPNQDTKILLTRLIPLGISLLISEFVANWRLTVTEITKREEELVRVALTSSFKKGGEEGGGLAVAAYKFSTYVLLCQEQLHKSDRFCHKGEG
jgi:hypothetical protein